MDSGLSWPDRSSAFWGLAGVVRAGSRGKVAVIKGLESAVRERIQAMGWAGAKPGQYPQPEPVEFGSPSIPQGPAEPPPLSGLLGLGSVPSQPIDPTRVVVNYTFGRGT